MPTAILLRTLLMPIWQERISRRITELCKSFLAFRAFFDHLSYTTQTGGKKHLLMQKPQHFSKKRCVSDDILFVLNNTHPAEEQEILKTLANEVLH